MSDINKNAVSCKQFRLTIFKLSVEVGIKFTEYCLVKMTNCARLKQVVLPIIRFLLRNIILFLSRMTIPITMFLLHKGDSSFKYYIFYTNDTLLSWLQNILYINRQHFRYKLILFLFDLNRVTTLLRAVNERYRKLPTNGWMVWDAVQDNILHY